MTRIGRIPLRFNTAPLCLELDRHPEVWNEIPYRTRFPDSPHREVDDVWVRYNALENYTGDGAAFNAPHTSVWYPVVDKLPSARLLALELYRRLEGERLGGVIITRIPPNKQVYPHVDPGWHARFYEKFVIQVRGSKFQSFCFEGESLAVDSGECYWFDNSVPHWVKNDSYVDRISLIVCMRRPRCH